MLSTQGELKAWIRPVRFLMDASIEQLVVLQKHETQCTFLGNEWNLWNHNYTFLIVEALKGDGRCHIFFKGLCKRIRTVEAKAFYLNQQLPSMPTINWQLIEIVLPGSKVSILYWV